MRKQELHPRTEALNKNQKNKSKLSRNAALIWLAAQFPRAFDNTLTIRPLKIGIMADIMQYAEKANADGISRSKLREAVVLFTRRIDYLTCLKAREMRVNLEGEPVSTVSLEDAERANVKIKKRIEKSARNARKLINKNPPPSPLKKPSNSLHTSTRYSNHASASDSLPYYHDRQGMYKPSAHSPEPLNKQAVVVKHKPSRAFDPNAVARLKEKLGLSRKTLIEQQEEETVE